MMLLLTFSLTFCYMFLSTWFKAPGLVYLFSLHQIITLYWQSEDRISGVGQPGEGSFLPVKYMESAWCPGSSETLPAGFQVNYGVWAVGKWQQMVQWFCICAYKVKRLLSKCYHSLIYFSFLKLTLSLSCFALLEFALLSSDYSPLWC